MAGQITISTLKDDAGVLATQNGMTGIAKAWVNFNGTGTPAIRGSFNVSSITDNATGSYTINFTTAMPNANYSSVGFIKRVSGDAASNGFIVINKGTSPTTSALAILTFDSAGGALDVDIASVAVFSS
jgi:hypothetical protein